MKQILEKTITWKEAGVWLFIYLTPYIFINQLPLERTTLPFILNEEQIPFLPFTFVLYLSALGLYFIVLRQCPRRYLRPGLWGATGIYLTSLFFFVVMPTYYPREAYPTDSVWAQFTRMIDGTGNCFPSLHVALVVFLTGCYSVFQSVPWKRVAMWVWAVFIVISVLTTKQHYLMDVGGGILIAFPAILYFRSKVKV